MTHITGEQHEAIDAIEETIRNLRKRFISPFRAWTNITAAISSAEGPDAGEPSELGDMTVAGNLRATATRTIAGTDDAAIAREAFRELVTAQLRAAGAEVFDIEITAVFAVAAPETIAEADPAE